MVFKQIDVNNIDSIRVLRSEVLYPNMNIDISSYDGDFLKTTSHYGLYGSKGDLIAVASMFNQNFKYYPTENAIRLRGMAVRNDLQASGYGHELLNQIVNIFRQLDFDFIWCNARENAIGFYEKFGFEIFDEKFEIKSIGIHYHAYLRLNQND
tara:strand:+ start:918 stop:1376 length:459 start_codon:yes stop_codon:yes gene_type:complete